MKTLVIVAHPNRASFNHAIAQTCSRTLTDNGHEVTAHDLYEEAFDPRRLEEDHLRRSTRSDLEALRFQPVWRAGDPSKNV